MRHRQIVVSLIAIMAAVAAGSSGIVIALLYDAAFRVLERRMLETVQSQAQLITTVATSNARSAPPTEAVEETLRQVASAHAHFAGFGETGEFTLARREGDRIIFLLRHRHAELMPPDAVPFSSGLAEPMRRALSGEAGTVVGLDYRGETVVAAYEPVDALAVGIVAKIDLAEVRAPFIRAGLLAGAVALLLVLGGTLLFLRLSNALVEALEANERKYRNLFEHSLDGVALHEIVTDPEGRPIDYTFLEVNSAFERLTGLKSADIVGRRVTEVLPGVERGPFIQAYGEVALTGRPTRFEHCAEPLNRHYDIAAFCPRHRQFAVVFSDTTERRRAEQAVRESERIHKLLADNVTDVIWTRDLDLRVTYVSPAVERQRGFTVEEAMALSLDEIMTPTSARLLRDALGESLAWADTATPEAIAEHSIVLDLEVTCKDGSTIFTEARIRLLAGADGRPLGVIGVTRDVTDRKRMEAQLRESERMTAMGAITGAVAHEVRNPLFALSATLDAFDARFGQREDFGRYMGRLREQIDRVSHLMRELLDYGRPHVPALVPSQVPPLIEEAAEACLPLAQRRKVELRLSVVEDLPDVPLDRRRIVQVFQNVIENAVQHAPQGGLVIVEAGRAGGVGNPGVAFVVRDSGSGFAPGDLPRIYEPFYTQRQGGTGLGLAIAERIVKEHNAAIVAENAPGGGAIVTVTLPRAGEA